ncbi:type II toxin-antitoxin system mRNA interferase toxin, RelE/StbE family [Patescibacteria group bacterium]|nr:type II toxin-antitoxin system mRNA interferase toxin, RelE/StbE family [Patescibacteria group bacterium]
MPKNIQERFKERILLFQKDQFDPVLNNHSLKGQYLGYRSLNISGDLRAIFKINGSEVIFVAIGSHSNLYG